MIVQHLSKSVTSQINSFKTALKEHGKHVAERNKRVQQYGVAADSIESLQSGGDNNAVGPSSNSSSVLKDTGSKYAMFANKSLDRRPVVRSSEDSGIKASTGLHQRSQARSSSTSLDSR